MLLAPSAGTTREGELDNALAALIRIGHTRGSLGHRRRAAPVGRVPASFPLGAHSIAAAGSSGDSTSSLVTVEAAQPRTAVAAAAAVWREPVPPSVWR
jgi:hypothetical protein